MKIIKNTIQTIKDNTSVCYILFALSLSGLLTIYFVNYLYVRVLPIYKNHLSSIPREKLELITNLVTVPYMTVFGISLLVGVIFLIWLPLSLKEFNSYETFLGVAMACLLFLLFIEIVTSIATNKVTGQLIFLLWLFLFNLIMLMGRVPKLLISWLKTGEETKFDVGKTTFVWGVIALILFLLGRK